MKIWKSKRQDKPGVWGSEVKLRNSDSKRDKVVENLLKKLEKEGFDARVS